MERCLCSQKTIEAHCFGFNVAQDLLLLQEMACQGMNVMRIFPVFIFICSFYALQAIAGDPVPDIKANGSDGTLEITSGDSLSISISLDSGGMSAQADWWAAAYATSSSEWFYYDLHTSPASWQGLGSSLNSIQPSYQGNLFDLPPLELVDTSSLPAGSYRIYFGVDLDMDGKLSEPVFYDMVEVTVNTPPVIVDCGLECTDGSVRSACMNGTSTCSSNISYSIVRGVSVPTMERMFCSYENGYRLNITFRTSSTTAADNWGGSCHYP